MLYLKKLHSIILIVIVAMVTGSVNGNVYAEPERPVIDPDCPVHAQDSAQPKSLRRVCLVGIRLPQAAGAAVQRRVSEHAALSQPLPGQ